MSADLNPKKARVEAIKEFLRLVVFGIVGGALAALGAAVNVLPEPWMQIGVMSLVTYLAKAWDKYTHKVATTDATGILPF